ncbi:thermonuclease family protein [uncultured Brevundimonas sp.]|uniref:thermonuclease family protein n=1 Tax=uncultured Brevundimonas sp. TaxID=213418 RepID=UPI002636188B|nr:thermonuclease family protein [uncultured Brevundimonas sp.]
MRPRYSPPKPASDSPLGLILVWCVLVAAAVAIFFILKPEDRNKVEQTASSMATTALPSVFPPSVEQAAAEADFRCVVDYVNDGDTLRCKDGTRVRLHAISARERDETCSPGHPCSKASAAQSTAALTRLVRGKTLDCMTTGQSYDRVTAICWTPDKVEVNCQMVQSGNASLWERFDNETRICRHLRRIGSNIPQAD